MWRARGSFFPPPFQHIKKLFFLPSYFNTSLDHFLRHDISLLKGQIPNSLEFLFGIFLSSLEFIL